MAPPSKVAFSRGMPSSFSQAMAWLPNAPLISTRSRSATVLLLSAMVGGLALARATAKSWPELSAEFLASLRTQQGDIALAT